MVLQGAHFNASVYGKNRTVVPFIGIMEHEDGSLERGIGVRCAHDPDKRIFQVLNSNDPLHYIRAFVTVSGLWEITDELVKDCIIACRSEKQRLEQFEQTSVYQKMGVHRQGKFLRAQKTAFVFKPSPELVACVTSGFTKHNAPLVHIIKSAPVAPGMVFGPSPEKPIVVKPALEGHFYKPCTDALDVRAATA